MGDTPTVEGAAPSPLYDCLGMASLGKCHYDPFHPPTSYFSVGEGIAAIAIFVAVFTLLDARRQFRLRVSPWFVPLVSVLFFAGIASTWVAAMIPATSTSVTVFHFPVLWEVSAGILFLTAIGLTVWRILRPVKFRVLNAERYLIGSLRMIAGGDAKDLSGLADEVAAYPDRLVNAAERLPRRHQREEFPDTAKVRYSRIAFTCLDILADKSFCRVLVTRNSVAAIRIIRGLLRNGNSRGVWGRPLVQEIVRQAIVNPDSILHREKGYSGLGLYKSFATETCGYWERVESYRAPLEAWQVFERDQLTISACHAYTLLLTTALEAYFSLEHPRFATTRPLKRAFETLDRSCAFTIRELESLPSESVSSSRAYEFAKEGQKVLEEAMKLLTENFHKQAYVPRPSDALPKDDDETIYGVLARAIFEHLQTLALCRKHPDRIRELVISIWMDVFPITGPGIAVLKIQDRLLPLLTKAIEENFQRSRGKAPLSRVLLSVLPLGGQRGNDPLEVELSRTICTRIVQYADQHDDVSRFLPDNIVYHSTSRKMVRTVWGVEREIFIG